MMSLYTDCGDGCTAPRMYLTPLNYPPEVLLFYETGHLGSNSELENKWRLLVRVHVETVQSSEGAPRALETPVGRSGWARLHLGSSYNQAE